jgi:hypothetical protein
MLVVILDVCRGASSKQVLLIPPMWPPQCPCHPPFLNVYVKPRRTLLELIEIFVEGFARSICQGDSVNRRTAYIHRSFRMFPPDEAFMMISIDAVLTGHMDSDLLSQPYRVESYASKMKQAQPRQRGSGSSGFSVMEAVDADHLGVTRVLAPGVPGAYHSLPSLEGLPA